MSPDVENGAPPAKDARHSNEPVTTTSTSVVRRRRRPPNAFASLFAPDGRRQLWMLTYICPHCKAGHRALARSEENAHVLRPRGACGRLVVIRVARTYRGREAA